MRKLLLLTTILLLLALPAAAYSDVPGDFWAADAIDAMTEAHVATGYPDDTFRPGDTVSRAQFTAMLLRACSEEEIPLAEDGQAWWQPYLDAASAAGLLTGRTGQPVFDPASDAMTAAITRYEAAALLDNASALWNGLRLTAGWEQAGRFSDEIPARYAASVESAAALGLLSGYPDGTFGGSRTVTRAQACALIDRLLDQSDWLADGQYQLACTGTALIRLTLDRDGGAVIESVRMDDGSRVQRMSVPMDNYVGLTPERQADPEGWAARYGRTALGTDGTAFWGEIGYYTYNEYGYFTQLTDRAVLAWAADGDGGILAVSHRAGRRPYLSGGGAVLPAGDQVVRIGADGSEKLLLNSVPDHGLRLTGITRVEGDTVYVAAEHFEGMADLHRYEYALEDGRLRPVVHEAGGGFSGFTPEEAEREQARLDALAD